jgi:transposase
VDRNTVTHDYQKILRQHGFKVSISGKGNCYDYAAVETFLKTIKAELIWRHRNVPDWGREIGKLGHQARLIPRVYVKPFMKRQKNDANTAETIAEAASRPTLRWVSVKSAEQQSQGMVFRTCDLFARQRSQLVNALRGCLAEYGVVVAQETVQFRRMITSSDEVAVDLPAQIVSLYRAYIDQIALFDKRIVALDH